MFDSHFESSEEAWESGYAAALHDLEYYLWSNWPWWMPRWLWGKIVTALDRAYQRRGSDL